MQKPLRRSFLVAAALVAGATLPSSGAGPTGVVSGVEEQALINAIKACWFLEDDARDLALAEPDQGKPLAAGTAAIVRSKLEEALACLTGVEASIAAGDSFPTDRLQMEAVRSLKIAGNYDEAALDPKKTAEMAGDALGNALLFKAAAMHYLMGTPTSRGDAAQVGLDPPTPTCCYGADYRSDRNLCRPDSEDLANGTGEVVNAKTKGKKVPPLKKYHYPKYLSTSATTPPRAPPNYYYAYEGKSAEPGYAFRSISRPLFGPFETRFQVGAFDPNATVDTGSACVEFDVEGSSPLQFVAVCGRRVSGGVQVFVQSHDGAAGNVFIPSTSIAQVVVDYSGTAFTVRAGIRDTPDFALFPVGTVNLAQGTTALIAGIGASGLTRGAEIGLDEIYFTPK